MLFDCPLGPKLVVPVWSYRRGCQGHALASGAFHGEERGAEGFFFLNPLYFLLFLSPHLICHSNILLDLAFFAWSAAPHYIEIYYSYCPSWMLDTVSLFYVPRTSFLQVQVCTSLTGHWWAVYSRGVSRVSLCPCVITPCLCSSTPPPVSPPLI